MKRSLLGEVNEYLTRRSKPFLITSGFILVLLVGVVDYVTGAELIISIIYLIPISLSVFFVNRRAGVLLSGLSSGIGLTLDLIAGHTYSHPLIVYWNNAVQFGFFIIIVFVLSALRIEYEKIVKLNIDLQNTLSDLKKTEERYRSYIEVTGQLGWTTNADGEVLEDIPAWRKFTGQGEEEVKGMGWSKALHPDDVEHTMQLWNKAVTTKSAYEVEYRIRKYDGVYRHFLTRSVPVFKKDGSIHEWVGTCIDITDRKRAEGALKKSELKYRTLIESSTDAILLLDVERNIVTCNQAFLNLFGYQKGEIEGRSIRIIHPSDESFHSFGKTAYPVIARSGFFRTEWGFTHKDGIISPAETVTSAIKLPDGSITGYIAIIRDITERKGAEEEREKLIHELQEALANIKTLRGLLPICSHCKKIRDDKGYWNQIESYIRDHSGAEFTHGMCPECMKKLYPDLVD